MILITFVVFWVTQQLSNVFEREQKTKTKQKPRANKQNKKCIYLQMCLEQLAHMEERTNMMARSHTYSCPHKALDYLAWPYVMKGKAKLEPLQKKKNKKNTALIEK